MLAEAAGVPVYNRAAGSGFSLVIEGKPGSSGKKVGHEEGSPDNIIASTFDPDVLVLPDLQIEVSRTLGNGSPTVCDDTGETAGGVPGTDPPDFTATQSNINVVNDLACRLPGLERRPTGSCLPSSSTVVMEAPMSSEAPAGRFAASAAAPARNGTSAAS
jgi:hypothetical protein